MCVSIKLYEGHDSNAEYSSMFHDMVHGHMLYDTVDFVLMGKMFQK